MKKKKQKRMRKKRREHRVRARIHGTAERPRLTVKRSAKHIYAQLIDDDAGHTLVSATSQTMDQKGEPKELAKAVGEEIAKRALKDDIKQAVFDRGSYRYHGRVAALAEGAREAGLKL